MAKTEYPIILGNNPNGKPTKVAIGMKSQMGAGMDVMILGLKEDSIHNNNCSPQKSIGVLDGRRYVTLHFCNMDALDSMIKCLQDTKLLWEKENTHGVNNQ